VTSADGFKGPRNNFVAISDDKDLDFPVKNICTCFFAEDVLRIMMRYANSLSSKMSILLQRFSKYNQQRMIMGSTFQSLCSSISGRTFERGTVVMQPKQISIRWASTEKRVKSLERQSSLENQSVKEQFVNLIMKDGKKGNPNQKLSLVGWNKRVSLAVLML
jgi:hypothetical protein